MRNPNPKSTKKVKIDGVEREITDWENEWGSMEFWGSRCRACDSLIRHDSSCASCYDCDDYYCALHWKQHNKQYQITETKGGKPRKVEIFLTLCRLCTTRRENIPQGRRDPNFFIDRQAVDREMCREA